jgi:8-oxo-dGTP pyrophosphatase MutT (NUDIX family)
MTPSIFPRAFMHYKPRSKKISGVILISKNNTILIVKGRKMNKWSFPKGHIQGSETVHQCALRECFEETGICLKEYTYTSTNKLNSGEYFIYRDLEEMKFNVYDTTEISDIAWVSIAGMMNLRTNTDVNAFLENYNRYL